MRSCTTAVILAAACACLLAQAAYVSAASAADLLYRPQHANAKREVRKVYSVRTSDLFSDRVLDPSYTLRNSQSRKAREVVSVKQLSLDRVDPSISLRNLRLRKTRDIDPLVANTFGHIGITVDKIPNPPADMLADYGPRPHQRDGPRGGPQGGPQDGPQNGPQDGPQVGPQDGPQDGPQEGHQDGPQNGPQGGHKKSAGGAPRKHRALSPEAAAQVNQLIMMKAGE